MSPVVISVHENASSAVDMERIHYNTHKQQEVVAKLVSDILPYATETEASKYLTKENGKCEKMETLA